MTVRAVGERGGFAELPSQQWSGRVIFHCTQDYTKMNLEQLLRGKIRPSPETPFSKSHNSGIGSCLQLRKRWRKRAFQGEIEELLAADSGTPRHRSKMTEHQKGKQQGSGIAALLKSLPSELPVN